MRRTRVSFLLAAGLVLAGPAGAQDVDLLVNGSFDEDLAGWNAFASGTSSASWNALDVGGSASSGSFRAEMVYLGLGNPNNVNLNQCLNVVAAASYAFGASIRQQAGGGEGGAFVRVSWFEDPGCGGDNVNTNDASIFLIDDTWRLAELTNVWSGSARSARFTLVNLSQDVSAPYVAFFDDAFFVPEPGAASAAAAALAALAGLRLRRA